MLLERYSFSKEATRGCFKNVNLVKSRIKSNENITRRRNTNNEGHNKQSSFHIRIRRQRIPKNKTTKEGYLMFCDSCQKNFKTRVTLQHHVRRHGEKRFFCKFCDYKSVFKSCLQQHEVMHAPKEFCKICNKHVTLLQRHMKSHKSKQACPICKKMYASFNLKAHLEKHKKESFKCKDCDAMFGINEDLKR